jgi:hypothetical protein
MLGQSGALPGGSGTAHCSWPLAVRTMLSGCLTLCCDLLHPAASGQLVVAPSIGIDQMHILELLLHVLCLKPYPVVIVLPGSLQYPDKVITPYACGITVWTEQRRETFGFRIQMPPDAWALHTTANPTQRCATHSSSSRLGKSSLDLTVAGTVQKTSLMSALATIGCNCMSS